MRLGLALAALAAAGSAAAADEVIGPLAERIRAATLIVEGVAGRGEASWDGTNPATIVTRTPFVVSRVLKGTLARSVIVLRQPGGAVGGAELPPSGAAQFDEGERDFVFVGSADPRDGSYDVAGGAAGKYRVTDDATGQPGLDVRLGVDAGAFSSKEKAPGTLLARLPAATFVSLAGGDGFAAAQGAVAPQSTVAPEHIAGTSPPGVATPVAEGASHRRATWVALTALAALGLLGSWRWHRARRR